MTRDEKIEKLTEVLSAGKIFTQQAKERIEEKTDEQLDYILSPIDQCIYLEACAGSGKTEVLGLKAAYEICRWHHERYDGKGYPDGLNGEEIGFPHFTASLFHPITSLAHSPVLFTDISRNALVTSFMIYQRIKQINHLGL